MTKFIATAFLGLFLFASAAEAQTYVRREISCNSTNQKFRTCETGLIRIDRLMLDRQRSSAPCVQGQTYGIDNGNRIAVSGGCRGNFSVEGYTYNVDNNDDVIRRDPPGRPGNPRNRVQETIRCESIDGRDQFCSAGRVRQVETVSLVRQLSRANCIPNRTFFAHRNGVMVTDGCRGDFVIRGRW